MILSFHPVITADENRLCAGRLPDAGDAAAIRRAAAVILPQGCGPELYRLARENCAHLFPNLDVRFDHPGKRGQIALFRRLGVAHPPTRLYGSVAAFRQDGDEISLPAVIKLDWGGEGRTVFKIDDQQGLTQVLAHLRACEGTGQRGFLLQPYIPHRQRCLRVTVIGHRYAAYWRIQPHPDRFGTSLAQGARIEAAADLRLQAAGIEVARDFCRRSGLQLAGFDLIFAAHDLAAGRVAPLMLEINYFFGRTGLGGSEAYYQMLAEAVDHWLAGIGLRRRLSGTMN